MASDFGIDQILSSDGSAVILKLRGDLDVIGARVLRSFLAEIQAADVLVRLDDLDFLDSSGLAAMLEAKGGDRHTRRAVRFEGANGDVRDVLMRTGPLESVESGARRGNCSAPRRRLQPCRRPRRGRPDPRATLSEAFDGFRPDARSGLRMAVALSRED